jgi:hypothetical protein
MEPGDQSAHNLLEDRIHPTDLIPYRIIRPVAVLVQSLAPVGAA